MKLKGLKVTFFIALIVVVFSAFNSKKADALLYGKKNTLIDSLLVYKPQSSENTRELRRKAYIASYRYAHGQSEWVMYALKKEQLTGEIKRKDNFKADADIANAISPKIYTKSGFDKGHLAPAADFSWSEQAMNESFFMSNMSPQAPGFNRGIWKKLEDKVRYWAHEKGELYIITGGVLNDSLPKLKEKVTVPRLFYKIVLDKNQNEAIAFLMNNESSTLPISSYSVSIDSLEKLLGINFFYQQDSLWQQKVECCFDLKKWKTE
jgi:endonuclease G, mitochondrial